MTYITQDAGGGWYNLLSQRFQSLSGTGPDANPWGYVDTGTNGRWGGRCIQFMANQANTAAADLNFGATFAHDTYIVGMGIRIGGYGGAGEIASIFQFIEAGVATHVTIGYLPGGTVVARRGSVTSGTTLGQSGSGILNANQWYYVEAKVVIHDSAGSVEVRVDTTPVLTLTGQDTRNAGTTGLIDAMRYGMLVTYNQPWYRLNDLYVLNGAGSINNNFLGDRRSLLGMPNAAGTYAQWTKAGSAAAATNWEGVDEIPHNSTDYNESNTVGQIDSFNFPNTPTPAVTINAVQLTAMARKNDAGSRTLQGLTRVGSTDYVTAAETVAAGSAFSRKVFTFETNPATSALWTGTEFDAAELGYKLAT